ncbi:hypothetical protein PASE110613_07170 [Paenibacillus sediminis]|uniref:MotA/TolQ/ExbB proton channel domain-containing protein n=1 Tax=Paenibacillus sediminis TaxID=664909 RepID=A0ABS4H209_9BACL|nr:hypothetical protein [Paenibacillus sediminis]MBP1936568.1 hypothetical protein [Paenibacillus sediminis]
MIHQIIHFYMKELGNYNLVFKKMKAYWFGYLSFLLIGGIVILLLPAEYKQYASIFLFVLTLAGLYLVNRKAKKVVFNTYRLDQDEVMWGGSSFVSYKEDMLKEYLETTLRLDLAKKSNKIIDAINKEIETTRLSIFFVPGIFIGLFIPIWNQYAVSQFKNISIRGEAVELLVSHAVGIVIITYLASALKFVLSDVIVFRRTRLKELVSLIEGISLKIDEGNSEK